MHSGHNAHNRSQGPQLWAAVAALTLLGPACTRITEFEDEGSTTSSTTAATEEPWTPPTSPSTSPASTTDPQPGSTSSTSAADASSGEAGCDFLGCGPDVPPIESCDFWDDDCPRGEKCTFYSNDGGPGWNAARCVPLAVDPAPAGDACVAEGSSVSGFDNCETGSLCRVLDSETLQGHCVPFCAGNPSAPTCEDPGRVCRIGGASIPTFCLERCNPLDPDACFPGVGCYPDFFADAICRPDASGPEGGAAFEPCTFTNSCDPGLLCQPSQVVGACLEGDEASCCTPWCDLEAADCPAPTTCVPAYEPDATPDGWENVGFCGQDPSR